MQIKEYVIAIASTVIISSMAEVLMPEGSFKKHISLVTGLFILFVMAKPILSIKALPSIDLGKFFDVNTSSTSVEMSEKLNIAEQKAIDTDFEKSLSDSISSKIRELHNINCKVSVLSENSIIKRLTVFSAENDEIRKTINEIYGLECDFKEE